ncbi:hypothetical protein [Chamaesiphon sp. VAR_48_metabat_403]|nr:hypothetical protein [Chamaesiphon sp. VAR_48_metabat_403]
MRYKIFTGLPFSFDNTSCGGMGAVAIAGIVAVNPIATVAPTIDLQ